MNVRTRFAPSPTGYLHVGGIRTALFAWLVARQAGGQFILRLEDTDQKREVEGAAQHIMDSLRALGLEYDEGPDIGGPLGPYRQSERLELYKEWATKLYEQGHAYADPYTSEEVDGFRKEAVKNKQPFKFRDFRPENPPKWDGKIPLRFRSWKAKEHDPNREYDDAVMGRVLCHWDASDDFVLMKSDGFPTYNFAHIIDDMLMECTHVIRGQEFLASTLNYLQLYEALGVEHPTIATMPHILGPTGTKKLSKRDGAKDVLDYIRDGYLPEALVSFIATLGWNDGTEQEVFSIDELISKFRLDRVQKSGARFDEQRLTWTNGHFIRQLPLEDLYQKVADYWPSPAAEYDDEYKIKVLGLVQERLKLFSELPILTDFFFADLPVNPELISGNKQLNRVEPAQLRKLLEKARQALEASDFSHEDLTNRLNSLLEETGEKPAVLFSLIRIATTQAPASPALADTLAVLGKDVALRRLAQQLATI